MCTEQKLHSNWRSPADIPSLSPNVAGLRVRYPETFFFFRKICSWTDLITMRGIREPKLHCIVNWISNTKVGSCHLNPVAKSSKKVLSHHSCVPREGFLGVSAPPPRGFPKFGQSWAESPVPWKMHPWQPNQNMGFIHLQIEWNPWLGGYGPQIPVLSGLFPQLNIWTPQKRKVLGVAPRKKFCRTPLSHQAVRILDHANFQSPVQYEYIFYAPHGYSKGICVLHKVVRVVFMINPLTPNDL
jgi:hypothetical protein